jgi:hypothetical protein
VLLEPPIFSEIKNFAFAIQEHWLGGLSLAAFLSVLVWIVSRLEPKAKAGNDVATLLISFLQDILSWIRRHKYTLISNSALLCIIYAAFLAYTDVNRQLKNPITITLETGNEAPFLQTDNASRLWVRTIANNNSANDVICRFFLNSLEKKGDSKAILALGESLQLFPAGGESGNEAPGERIVPGNSGKIFNLAYIENGGNELSIQSVQFSLQVSEKLLSGIYKLTVQARHSTCRSDPTDIWIKYEGDQQVSFIDGR